MSMYSTPRSLGAVDTSTGNVMPSTIAKIREKRSGLGDSSADSDDFSKSNYSQKSKSFAPYGGLESKRMQGDSDLIMRPISSFANQEGAVLKGVGKSANFSTSSRVSDGMNQTRSYFQRRSGSRIGGGSASSKVISSFTMLFWTIWAVSTVSLTVAFVLVYWLQTVPGEQMKVSSILVESATAVSASYFAPLTGQLLSFNASMGAGLIASSSDFAQVSATSFPFFSMFPYIQQAEFLFSESDTLRVRPAAGPDRILSCLSDFGGTTNMSPIPTIYTQNSTNCIEANLCQFGLMCEDTSFQPPANVSTILNPYLFSPPESPQKKIVAVSLANEVVQITASLAALSALLSAAFPSDLVFVINAAGMSLGTSEPTIYPPVTVDGSSLVLAPSLLAGGYPWSFLLPSNLTTSWSSGTLSGWELRINRLPIMDGATLFVLVVTETSAYLNYTLWVLGWAVIIVALLPTVYLLFVLVLELSRRIRLRHN